MYKYLASIGSVKLVNFGTRAPSISSGGSYSPGEAGAYEAKIAIFKALWCLQY